MWYEIREREPVSRGGERCGVEGKEGRRHQGIGPYWSLSLAKPEAIAFTCWILLLDTARGEVARWRILLSACLCLRLLGRLWYLLR